ncbi:hypothetical protein J1N35_007407 [Gossypium stocksii]|uniref:Uncharacterized protein n=1 Tax=Gossypium stocksii TaxID=47602 RepID=A0A9D4AF84_9ROSI|nr:hypothetical protein J1N35_007407 [Gossypium stocksii]
MSAPINKYILNLSKLELLNGPNYRRWSQRMVIFFEQLEVDYVLFNPPITEGPGDSITIPRYSDVNATKVKFEKDNKMVRGHMLSHMANNLFDLFVKKPNQLSPSRVHWKRNMEPMMLGSRNMSLKSDSNFQ